MLDQAQNQCLKTKQTIQQTHSDLMALAEQAERATGTTHQLNRASQCGQSVDGKKSISIAAQTNTGTECGYWGCRAGEQGRGFLVVADEFVLCLERVQKLNDFQIQNSFICDVRYH